MNGQIVNFHLFCKVNLKEDVLIHLHIVTQTIPIQKTSCVAVVAGKINNVSNLVVSETSNVESGPIVQGSVASGSIDDHELEEDCIASEASINLTGQPMANVLQSEHIENDMYSCAPGENNMPHYMLMDSEFEVHAFPDLFPYGLVAIQ